MNPNPKVKRAGIFTPAPQIKVRRIMKNIINNLIKSPLFNLSLSSKELFHSNFMYWLGKNYPTEIGILFGKYLKTQPSDYKINIFREKNNIDISILYQNNEMIIIENKVKSIPNFAQLQKYSLIKNRNKTGILLSLSKPLFFEDKTMVLIENIQWFYLDYSTLAEMLKKINVEDLYHKQIIFDYINFIKLLDKINELSYIKDEDNFNFHSKEEDNNYKILEEIRMHDFYLKKKYNTLAYILYKEIKLKYKYYNINFDEKIKWDNTSNILYINSDMTNGMGLLEIKYKISEKLCLGIQIQGEHYRMLIESIDDTADKIKEILFNELFWFEFLDEFKEKKTYPKNGFNRFGNNFFYKSIKLGNDIKIKELIELILKDVDKIEKNKSFINSIAL